MRELTTTIEIAAPPVVWRVLTDFNSWKQWNPIVTEAVGTASQGANLSITMKDKDGNAANKYAPVITGLEAPKSLKWRATMMAGFVFTNDKIFTLEATPTGTRLIHTEAFSGMLMPLF